MSTKKSNPVYVVSVVNADAVSVCAIAHDREHAEEIFATYHDKYLDCGKWNEYTECSQGLFLKDGWVSDYYFHSVCITESEMVE